MAMNAMTIKQHAAAMKAIDNQIMICVESDESHSSPTPGFNSIVKEVK
jgi:hypothetical protein